MDQINRLLSEIDNLGRQGRDIEMIPIFHQAVKEARLRGDEALLARLLNDFGGVLRNTGNYATARDILEEAKLLVERIGGPRSQAYATTLLNAGTLYIDAQDYRRARVDLEKALKVANRLQLDNLVYASICNNLGILNLREQRYKEAYEYQKIAMGILRTKENSRVKLAIACSNFAETCKLLGNTEEYFDLLEEAKTLLNSAVGENHPLYAMVVNNLASTFYREGKVEEAKTLLEDALAILETTYGKEGKGYRAVANNLEIVTKGVKATDSILVEKQKHTKKTLSVCEFREGTGLYESYQFFTTTVYPILEEQFQDLLPRLAAGLAGKGSECLGYDDAISRDHDFECKVLLWVQASDYFLFSDAIRKAFESVQGGKVYLIPIQDFYNKYTGTTAGPESIKEWRSIPEDFLATVTNGAVYMDNLGVFTQIRDKIRAYYPEDVRLKRLAFHALKLAQSGQYNYPRAMKRQDMVAASLALREMMHHAMAMVFHLNKRFMPFYKWQYRALQELPILGGEVGMRLQEIAKRLVADDQNEIFIEEICQLIIARLKTEGLSQLADTFLLPHGYEIVKHIQDETLRAENPWVE